MVDVATKLPLRVLPNERAGPYLRVSMDQLPALKQVLDRHAVFYWEDGFATKLGGLPAITYVNFGHKGKARQADIQALLDAEG